MKILYVTDLHGDKNKYRKSLEIAIEQEIKVMKNIRKQAYAAQISYCSFAKGLIRAVRSLFFRMGWRAAISLFSYFTVSMASRAVFS